MGPSSVRKPTRPPAPWPAGAVTLHCCHFHGVSPSLLGPLTLSGSPIPRTPLVPCRIPADTDRPAAGAHTPPQTQPRKDTRWGGGGSLPEGQASRAAHRPLWLPALPVRNAGSGEQVHRLQGRATWPGAAWAPVIPRDHGHQIGNPYRLRGSVFDDATCDLFYKNITE